MPKQKDIGNNLNNTKRVNFWLFGLLFYSLLNACSTTPPVIENRGIKPQVATLATEQGGAFYFLKLDLDDNVPDNPYLRLSYQDLANPEQVKQLDIGYLGDARRINFKSLAVDRVKANYYYRIQLILYDNDKTQRVVASWADTMSLELSSRLASLLNITLI